MKFYDVALGQETFKVVNAEMFLWSLPTSMIFCSTSSENGDTYLELNLIQMNKKTSNSIVQIDVKEAESVVISKIKLDR